MAGLRSKDVKTHLSWFCSKTARVHELVSRAEAFRATREEAALTSDPEGNAVTVAYVQGNQPGKSFAQNQRFAAGVSTAKSQGDGKTAQTQVRRNERKFNRRERYGPIDASKCAGKCCFRCRKEGHFIADCRGGPNKCLYLAFESALPCDDATNEVKCRCACGRHSHFMNTVDVEQALVVLTRKSGKAAK